MRKELIEREAAACRKRAEEFAGRAEEPFLLNLAAAFDDLADRSQEVSKTRRPKAASIEPFDYSRQAKRERVTSVLVTAMALTLGRC